MPHTATTGGLSGTYAYSTAVTHQGLVIAFASGPSATNPAVFTISYFVLQTGTSGSPGGDAWTDAQLLPWPTQIRPVGLRLMTFDIGPQAIAVNASFRVLSDGTYIYVFRPSVSGTLLVDRFLYDQPTGKLVNVTEVRYRRSRNPDVPAGPRDTFGSTDMEGKPFIEPTTELTFINNLSGFAVLILPTSMQSVSRWQIFVANGKTGTLDSYSLLRSDDGLFDLTDAVELSTDSPPINPFGLVPPNASFSLTSDGDTWSIALGPVAVVYAQQVRARDQYGRMGLFKRELRVMAALGVQDDTRIPTAILDFGVGQNGKLAQVSNTLPISPAPAPAGDASSFFTALAFDASHGTTVTVPPLVQQSPTDAGTIETWLWIEAIGTGIQVVLQYQPQSTPNGAASVCLAIDQAGAPVFQVVAAGASSTVRGASLTPGTWYHLAGTWTTPTASPQCTLFVNGQTFTCSGTLTPPQIAPGMVMGGGTGFTGRLTEVRLWSIARSLSQILATMDTTIANPEQETDLVDYWPLDEPPIASPPVPPPHPTTVRNLAWTGAAYNGTLAGAMWVPSNAPRGASMPVVAWDANGLTAATTLLPFAVLNDTPFLLAGADGLVHLYFPNAEDAVLSAAQYDTQTAHAQYGTTWTATAPDSSTPVQGTLRWVARQTGTAMNSITNAVVITLDSAEGEEPTCQVTLTGYTGYQEVWPGVPTGLASFVAVLNGDAVQTPAAGVDVPAKAVTYNYKQVTHAGGQQGPDPAPGVGSALFTVHPEKQPDDGWSARVNPAGSDSAPAAVLIEAGIDCWWIAAPPPAAFPLGAASGPQYVQVLPSSRPASNAGVLSLEQDLCVEAWVNPTSFSSTSAAVLVLFDAPNNQPAYLLGLDAKGYLFALNDSVASYAAGDPDNVPVATGTWTHVAANYRTDYGIALQNKSYLDAGHNASFNTIDAVTVEAWVQLDSVGSTQTLISKWDEDRGGSWRLYVDDEGSPTFEVVQDTASGPQSTSVQASQPLATGKPWHIAGVYDVSSKRETVVYLQSGQGDAIDSITMGSLTDPVTAPPAAALTIEMWFRGQNMTLEMSAANPMNPLGQFQSLELTMANGSWGLSVWETSGSPNYSVSSALTCSGWTHLAATYDVTAGASLYVNGNAITTQSNGSPVRFATPAQYQMYAAGWVSEVRLWSRALSIDEIRQNMLKPLAGDEAGLVGYWPMNDRFGTIVGDRTGLNNGTLVGGNFEQVDKGTFIHKLLVNGQEQASQEVTETIRVSDTSVRLGADASSDYLQGTIDMVRVWNRGLMDWEITQDMTQDVSRDSEGLVSAWNFETGSGAVAYDLKDDNNALIKSDTVVLTDQDLKTLWVPTYFLAGWTLYINGVEVPVTRYRHQINQINKIWVSLPTASPESDALNFTPPALPNPTSEPQCSLGALIYDSTVGSRFNGTLVEVRFWSERRTAAQLRENMFRSLTGQEHGLVGYWPLNDGSGSAIRDLTGNGNDGQVQDAAPAWVISTARIQDEPPAVRFVSFPIASPYDQRIRGTPAVAEYATLEVDAAGLLFGVAEWALVYQASFNGSFTLSLSTGYKVGDLDLQYVGQVQTHPTIVGYIEGAPPLPSENLTVDSPVTPYKYLAASSITLTDAENTEYVFTASRDTGFDQSHDAKFGYAAGVEYEIGTGFTFMTVADSRIAIGVHGTIEHSLGWLSEATSRRGLHTNVPKTIDVFGAWEENTYQSSTTIGIDPRVLRYYLPNNKALALVKSGTADLYALRLKGDGTLVAYTMRPSPDIPEDTNLIMFVLNPQYVKNGTLDGWVGFQQDHDYPYLQPGDHGSFFKPLEAYALKSQIEREHKMLWAAYELFQARRMGQQKDFDVVNADLRELIEQGKDWLAKRSLVNTYVWNSDGGLYAEEEQFSAVHDESLGGSYEFVGKFGVYFSLTNLWGIEFSLDSLLGGHVRTKVMKTKQEGRSFGITVKVPGEGFLNRRAPSGETKPGSYPVPYEADSCPGKVNQYRFMTFYLAPSTTNFADLASIVDPDWLNRQGAYAGIPDPDAFAMKQALANPNEVWRVLHRVTYVNRIADTGTASVGESIAPPVQQPDADSLAANVLLIDALPIPQGNPRGVLPAINAELNGLIALLETNSLWGAVLAQEADAVTERVLTYMQYRRYVELLSIAILPATPSLAVGATLQLQALEVYGDGSTQDVTANAAWVSDAPDVATVTSPGGSVQGIAAGSAQITATCEWNGMAGSTTIEVQSPAPDTP